MMSSQAKRFSVLLGGLATVLVALGAAQESPQTVDVGGVTFEVPASWKKVQPKSSMRRAQLEVPAVEGDTEPGELVVFVFPEGAGTVQDNVERWRNQFKDDSGKSPAVDSKTVKGKNVDVTRVSARGTFTDPFAGKGPQKGFRLLGGIVQTPKGGYYLKLIGPEKTINAAEKGFDALLASVTAQN
jgi:hypothetical protein